eukprot:1339795-Rhodomonas_salina.1
MNASNFAAYACNIATSASNAPKVDSNAAVNGGKPAPRDCISPPIPSTRLLRSSRHAMRTGLLSEEGPAAAMT